MLVVILLTWPTAATCVNMSGAPLPKASSVAPATAGASCKYSDISSSAGQKKRSDMVSRIPKENRMPDTRMSTESHCLRGIQHTAQFAVQEVGQLLALFSWLQVLLHMPAIA